MSEFAKKELDLDELEKWDTAFVTEKLKEKELKLDEQELKPYFPLDSVLNGLFKIADLLYEIEFKENSEIDVYHKDVKYLKFIEKGSFMLFFMQIFFLGQEKEMEHG